MDFIAEDRERQVHLRIEGQGEVTVVFLTGLGTPALWWHDLGDWAEDVLTLVQRDTWEDKPFLAPELAGTFQVLTYDRAGVGESTPPHTIRNLEDFLQELDSVLTTGQINGPVALVAHSIGGVIALEYVRRYPEQVSALALLDSSHPNQIARFAVVASSEQLQAEAEERQLTAEDHPERPELEQLLDQGAESVQPGMLGNLPLLVVTRGVRPWPGKTSSNPMTFESWQRREKIWQDMQVELAAMSSRATQLHLTDSGHYVYLDQPEQVIAAITELFGGIQSRI